jgi:UDP-glucose 4-epimerase
MGKNILVTGGTGYIGSHTVVELLESGYEVTIIDNLNNSDKDVVERIQQITGKLPVFYEIDLKDKRKFFDFLQSGETFDAVIHFAAYKAVGESVENPLMYYQNNIGSLLNVLEGMEKFNIPNIVFSSSCTVYGEPEELPVTENTPVQKAASPYGNTKKMAEEIILDTTKANRKTKAISLRYFNPIGAHKSALIGELPLGVPNNLIPFVTQTAIGLRKELKVFGDDYNTPDGTCVRDYIYVSDLAKAHVIAIERLIAEKNKSQYEVFNIGTGNGNSVMEVITSFEKVSKLNLNYSIADRRSGDVEKVFANVDYANTELGWKAETSLEDALHSAWEWEKNYRNNIEKKKEL